MNLKGALNGILIMGVMGIVFMFPRSVVASPTVPPPPGKVWVKMATGWSLVSAPPSNAPFRWVEGHWIRITEIPPGKEWVPPHWGKDGWVPGHWRTSAHPHPWPHRVWVSGHHAPRGRWIP